MGYYRDENTQKEKGRGGCARSFFSAIAGAMMGGLLVLLLLPSLVKTGYVSLSSQGVQNQPAASTPASQIVSSKESPITTTVNQVADAVVGVIAVQDGQAMQGISNESVEQGTGSGVIFRKTNGKAYIVTNNHVIDGADTVEISLSDKDTKRIKVNIVGTDPITDLAVLEIDGTQVKQVAEFGDSSKLQVGERAIAIGNPLGMEFSRTVTQGIISSTERTMPIDLNKDGQSDYDMKVIQTDAAINPGNSGGPLMNAQGQVIGINSLKIAKAGVEGLGFAIPSTEVKRISDELIQHGKVRRPYIGIEPVDLAQIPSYEWKNTLNLPDEVQNGVIVREAVEEGPAAQAGLAKYDIIVRMDNQTIENSAQLRKYLFEKQAGDTVQVAYYRNGQLKKASIKLDNY
ncbi:S1C family serine protease [Aneurinibacillus sp. REN35]|uniref:S1C family serine protease n=1 Tax=Aneurinibacillus sp. REN35 TaxID=3237286 RepID=UPI0035296B06